MSGTYKLAPDELRDKAWLEEEYVTKGRSGLDIAKELGLNDASQVYRYLDRHGIPRRPKSSRSDFAETVEVGIKETIVADKRHNRRPCLPLFTARVKAVLTAKGAKESISLRGALIDLAALCQHWAETIPFSPVLQPAGDR